MCYRYAIANDQKTFATGIRKWSRPLNDFPTPKFQTMDSTQQWLAILTDIYTYLCVTDGAFKSTLINTGPHPFRQYGLEWFGSREFFDRRRQASQALWMDLALARRSGQELRNNYVITKSPEYAPLSRFFRAAVDQLQIRFDASLVTSVQPGSLIAQMRAAVADCDDISSEGSLMLYLHLVTFRTQLYRRDLRWTSVHGTPFPPLS